MTVQDDRACPACVQAWRAEHDALGRFLRMLDEGTGTSGTFDQLVAEFRLVHAYADRFVKAHHANQVHALNEQLEGARRPAAP